LLAVAFIVMTDPLLIASAVLFEYRRIDVARGARS
jgi:hypothetical protein